jgi:hypothetical protein
MTENHPVRGSRARAAADQQVPLHGLRCWSSRGRHRGRATTTPTGRAPEIRTAPPAIGRLSLGSKVGVAHLMLRAAREVERTSAGNSLGRERLAPSGAGGTKGRTDR